MSATVGLAAGVKPSIGVALAIGVAFSLVTISDVTAGLVLFTILSFLDVLNSSSSGAASFIKVAGLLLFASWYAQRLVGTARGRAAVARHPQQSPVLRGRARSVVSGQRHLGRELGRALTSTLTYVLNMLLLPIVMVGVRRREHLYWVLAAFLAGAIISTAYGFISPAATGSVEGRLAGGIGDANEQAAVLVAAIPIAIALGSALRRPALRLLVLGRRRVLSHRRVHDPLARWAHRARLRDGGRGGVRRPLAGQGRGAAGRDAPGHGHLLLRDRAAGGSRARDKATTSGRSDIWRVGWRMVQAHPLTGVGSGNFQEASVHYVQGIGTLTAANLIVDVPHVAHNVYLELLADLGIPGLIAFLGVAGCSALAAGQAARRFERQGDVPMELMSRCLVLALVAFLSADFFLSGEFSKQLWLTFALCPAVLALSRSDGAEDQRAPVPDRAPDPTYRPQPAY